MKRLVLAAVLAAAVGSAWGQAAVGHGNAARMRSAAMQQSERAELIRKIVKAWGPYVQAVHGENIGLWADRLVPTFRNADTPKLRLAATAVTFEGVMNALTGQKAANTYFLPNGVIPKALGSSTGDLVFTPLPSCNLVDTRNAGGPLGYVVPRNFKASGFNFLSQGGSGTNCGIPFNPTALLLGVTAVDPTAKGWFKLWPYGGAQPLSSALSYGPSQNTRNDIVLKVAQGLTQDFTILSNTTGTHVLISVLGYYAAPEATAADCLTIGYNFEAQIGATAVGFAECPSGFAVTGGACSPEYADLAYGNGTALLQSWVENDGYTCLVKNGSLTTKTALNLVQVRCCRLPGR